MSKVLQERGFRSLPSSTETNPRDQVKSISTTIEADSNSIRRIGSNQYAVSTGKNSTLLYKSRQMTVPFPSQASVSVMPLLAYLNLGLGELAHTRLTVELADRTVKYPKGIAKNVLDGIGKFTFLIDFIILDMLEDVKVPLILGRPFLSTARAKIDVYKRKITLRVREEKIIFKSVKPASSIIKRVYMLSLRERMELDLEARLMGETLVLNRSEDPFSGDYIELNDLNEPFRRNQGDDLMPTIKEGEVIEEFRTRDKNLNTGIDDYPSYCDDDKKIHIDFLEDMDAYRDNEMGDIIFGKPFLREVGIKTKWFKGIITLYNGDNEVTYQMVRSHPKFKHHTNKKCNKIPPLLKDPTLFEFRQWKNGSHAGTLTCMSWSKKRSFGVKREAEENDDEASNHEDALDTGAAPKQQQQVIPQTTTISNIKLPILKKEYDIWAMEMEHYLEYIDNDVWKVIQNGNSKKRISTGKDGVIRILPPVTAAEIQAVEKERKAENILLMTIPKEHMRRFHGMDDAKEIWEAIRTRFGGNANSKKMQKAVFKQQFEAFTISSSEGSLPPAWSNLAMTMRTKPDVDTLSIDDLYNNLRVFEQEIQGASKTSSSAQNVAFVSQSKSSTNKVKSGFTGAYSTCTPSTSSTNIPEKEALAGFADEVIYSLFAKQSEDWDLLHEDLEQIDDLDIEEMDINWQIAMIAIRMKKFYKKTGRRVRVDGKAPVGFDKKKLECFNCHNTGHFARECTAKGTHDGKKKRDSFYQHQEAGKQEKNQMGLLTMDDGIVNWGEHTEDEETNHALMAISSSSEVSLCSKTCIDSYNTLKTLCDEQMNQLGDQEAQILAYSQAVKKLEAQLVTFQKQQLSLNEKLTFQANEIYEKDEKLKKYRRIGMKAVKEKEQLQKTLDSWKDSSKNLWRLINSSMSSSSKIGLGYEIKSNNEVLSYEEEMNFFVFCTKEDSVRKPLYSRFIKTNDFKGVPHPLSGDYTPKPQEEIDESLYVYGKKGTQEPEPSVSDDRSSKCSTCQSNDSARSIGTSFVHSVDFESKISRVPQEVYVSKPITTNEKGVSAPNSKEVKPSCVTYIKTPRQPIKDQETTKVNRKNWNAMMERELGEGYSFTKKKCFVCGSLSHLIKDCDYYEKKMAREVAPKKQRVFNTGNRMTKPVWNTADRINHANHFVPRSAILNSIRPNVNTVRTNINSVRQNVDSVCSNITTGRTNINSVRQNVDSVWSNINTGRTNINSVKQNVDSVCSNINTGRTNVNSVRPRVSTVSSNVNTVRSR
ncbi:putative ribonuclease H-like domain-containing protein [Tanacetum coccineum]